MQSINLSVNYTQDIIKILVSGNYAQGIVKHNLSWNYAYSIPNLKGKGSHGIGIIYLSGNSKALQCFVFPCTTVKTEHPR